MGAYILRRLLLMIPTLLIMTLLIFFVVYLIPGNLADAILAQPGQDPLFDKDRVERELGLDAPLIIQYGRWMGFAPQMDGNFSGIVQGNLGDSWWRKVPVSSLIGNVWPVTLQLGLMGLIVAQLIALPIGIYSALRQDKWGDYIGRSFAILCISVPGFWLGTLIIVLPAIWWRYLPPIYIISFPEDPINNLRMFIAPAIVLGMALAGMTMRMTRTMMLEVLRQDYIRTAWAKGLRERVVIIRHALKNALIPVVTLVGIQVPILLGGTVIIEQVFNLPGMGRMIIEGALSRDEPLLSGTLLIFSVALVIINLMVDLTYAYLDPRVHYK